MSTVLHHRRSKLTKRDAMMSSEDGIGAPPDLGRVGAQLRAARERNGWTLADVSASLRIRYVHLLALEEGRTGELPGLTYAVGFVRSYAKLLGLDPDEMSRRLRAEIGVDSKPELEFPAPAPERGVPAGVVVLIGAVLAIGAYVAWYRESGDRPSPAPVQVVPDRLVAMAGSPGPKSSAAGSKSAASVSPATASAADTPAQPAGAPDSQGPAAPESTAAVPPTSAAAAGLPHRDALTGLPGPAVPGLGGPAPSGPQSNTPPHVALRATADAWVQVRDSKGQVLLNRILRAGETWQVPPQPAGQPPLLLTTGNAGGTELVVDGVVSPTLGASGAVKRDLPLDPTLIREGKLRPQVAAKTAPAHGQPAEQ